MTPRLVALTVVSLSLLASLTPAQAQSLPLVATNALYTLSAAQRQGDYIVAVVNTDPITRNEVRQELERVTQQLTQERRPLPERQLLARQVLERLINDKVQLQQARDTGIRIDESAIDTAEQNIARQNQLDLAELRRRLVRDGVVLSQLRNQLRDQLMITRVREREVESRLRISDLEVDQYLHEQQNNTDPTTQEINLSHLFIAVPDAASPEQIAALQTRAQRALTRAQAGEDFVALVREFSDAPDLANGGQMGLRPGNRYPPLFFQATQALSVGEVSALLHSGAGFHILKVIEKINTKMPTMAVTQSHARHILLRPTPQLSEAAVRSQLSEFKKQVVNSKADFAALAREHSKDASAASGGDLGWTSPGTFVLEFEAIVDRLTPGQVSDPLTSRFGVHLIQLLDRRKVALNPREQREAVRAMLRDKKLVEAYTLWGQELRSRAYIEMREPPT